MAMPETDPITPKTHSVDGVLDVAYAEQRQAREYLRFRYRLRALVAARAIRKYAVRGGPVRLIDFGAAEGLTLLEMAKVLGSGEYLGVEYDQGLIDRYHSSILPNMPAMPVSITLLQGDVNHLGNVDGDSADVITALAILEHLQDPVLALKEAFRILTPGGLFVATAPSPLWDKISDVVGPANQFGGDHHFTTINKSSLEDLGRKSGFEFLEYFRFMWTPVGVLPCFGCPISASFAWSVDRAVRRLRVLDWSFANQCAVLRKPGGQPPHPPRCTGEPVALSCRTRIDS
jgi:ubiquinone/menaquinone biosynthesis C-methylase UbiE